ncbi:glycosyltransferase family 59 protein [Xylariomycetidae sp. FL0641]|nr:glycosyltransferase family 59 protein [Xylariomycetidae sp. FL0641]
MDAKAAPPGIDTSLTAQAVQCTLIYTVTRLYTKGPHSRTLSLAFLVLFSLLNLAGRQWLRYISKHAPEPYLDEVFHIPQAQVYCEGRYEEWDDKITTPPGLYGLTILFHRVMGLSCSVYNLRIFNVDIVSYLALAITIGRYRLDQLASVKLSPGFPTYAIGTGLNVALFPVLFFFSGLYYTDPASTLVVVLAYTNHLARFNQASPSIINDFYTLCLGLLALCMRQTNIFWVAVYIGGLEVVHGLRAIRPAPAEIPKFTTLADQAKFYVWRYSLGDIHDPPLHDTQAVDIALCAVSIGIAAICNLNVVVRRFLWPHGMVLVAFVAFVAWNGGVVLGDKSNHVATIHLAQMLYIWPLFTFFSAPLLIPVALRLVYRAWTFTTSSRTPRLGKPLKTPYSKQSPALNLVNALGSSYFLQAAVVLLLTLASALLIARYNTIIHPFTLADNRHYMFYVFRYSILRAPWVRYALAPVYIGCAYLCWGALQGPSSSAPRSPTQKDKNKVETSTQGTQSPPTSTVLLLLLTTALSLITAPLVEPRYFILPWVFWRLLVPPPSSSAVRGGGRSHWSDVALLVAETAWHVLINVATMYIFITRPFYWWAPDGTVADGGNVQRFMW